MSPLRVRIWNEHVHEREDEGVAAIYPDGIHEALRTAIADLHSHAAIEVSTLADDEQGLAAADLDATDVLVWWGTWRRPT